MTHTPGPWRRVTGTTIVSDSRFIANCGLEADDGSGKIYAESVANARLIAAAPDLLAMLKMVTARLESEVQGVYCNGDGEVNQGMTGCYERDMQPVRDAQALIAAIEGAEVTA